MVRCSACEATAESMRRMTHVISSEPIKDRTVVGASDKIERMPIT